MSHDGLIVQQESRNVPKDSMNRVSQQIEINAPREAVFALFSNFDHFPRWMKSVKKVEPMAEGRAHWTVEAPEGTLGEWTTEVTALEPEQRVAWHSTGINIEAEGEASFTATERGTTLVRLTLGYDRLSELAGPLITEERLARQLEEDLIWFRLMVERENRTSPSAPLITTMPLSGSRDIQPAHSLPAQSSRPSATLSAAKHAQQMRRSATSDANYIRAANQRRHYSPIIVKLDTPLRRPSDEDTTVLTTRARANAYVPLSRSLLIGIVTIGLLLISSAGWIVKSRWPAKANKPHTETTTNQAVGSGNVPQDKPATAAGLEPTPTFDPDGALASSATEENLSPKERTTKAQRKAADKRAVTKRSATGWLTGWLKPVVKPFMRKKAEPARKK